MKIYKYGMKYRPFSIGCQPMQNLIEAQEDPTNEFYNILIYSRQLTPEEISNYQLTDMQPKPDLKTMLIDLYKSLNKPFLKDLDTYARTEAGQSLLNLIRSYAAKEEPQPDFIEYIQELKNDNSISCQEDYYEIINYMAEVTAGTLEA